MSYALVSAALAAACLFVTAQAQQPTPPPFATTKVDGTDNVYIFRFGNHQSMFVVTSAGVVAHVHGLVVRDEGDVFRLYFAQEYGHSVAEAVIDAAEGLAQ